MGNIGGKCRSRRAGQEEVVAASSQAGTRTRARRIGRLRDHNTFSTRGLVIPQVNVNVNEHGIDSSRIIVMQGESVEMGMIAGNGDDNV